MAGSKLKAHVKASTILEVVVSMVIIVIVFGIAMMIYTNVTRMSLSVKKIRAQAILQQMLLTAEQTNQLSNQSLTIDDFRIEKEVKFFNDDTLLNEINLTAFDANQQKITELQKVITRK